MTQEQNKALQDIISKFVRMNWANEYAENGIISRADAIKVAELYALSERKRTWEEAKLLLDICDKTFGLIHEIVKKLKDAEHAELPELVEEIDIDFELIQAKIRDAEFKP